MSEPEIIQRSFQRWKIWLAVFFGLFVAGWMVFNSMTEVQFIQTEDRSGDHIWRDYNKNGHVDTHIPEEFIAVPQGNFRKQTVDDVLTHIHWTGSSVLWFLIALAFMVGRDLFYIIRIRLLTKNELSLRSGFQVIMLWEFASALAPGVMSGATVAMFILHKEKIALGRSTAIVIITAMMDNLFYVIMIPFVFLMLDAEQLFPHDLSGGHSAEWIFWIGFVIILSIFLFFFISIFLFPNIARQFLQVVFSIPFLDRWKNKAIETGNDIETASREFRNEKIGYWLKVFGATCASWVSRYLVINALLAAFLQLRFSDHLLILAKQFVLWLFMRMSPTPGGSGVAEYAFGELLIPFGQSAILLAGLAIIWRLISYFPYIFIGAFLLPRWLKKNR